MMTCRLTRLATLLLLLAAGPVLAAERSVTISFGIVAGAAPVGCATPAAALGRPAVAAGLRDARFYVHDLTLIDAAGKAWPVMLEETLWQHDGVALIDAEDATGACREGTPETNTRVTGQVDDGAGAGPWRLAFTLGVPQRLNHTATDLAPPPLDLAAMGWGWQAGRKYVKLELLPEGGVARPDGGRAGTWFLHLGATGCTGNPVTGEIVSCDRPNRPAVTTRPFDPARERVVLDLAVLFAATDLARDQGGAVGCMSAPDDADCPALFERLGLAGGVATAFRVVEK